MPKVTTEETDKALDRVLEDKDQDESTAIMDRHFYVVMEGRKDSHYHNTTLGISSDCFPSMEAMAKAAIDRNPSVGIKAKSYIPRFIYEFKSEEDFHAFFKTESEEEGSDG